MSSAPMSPSTNDTAESQSCQTSTPPSSPPSESPGAGEKKASFQYEAEAQRDMADDDLDDDEDMGTKAKALMNLLKTSSVCLQDFKSHLLCANQEPSI